MEWIITFIAYTAAIHMVLASFELVAIACIGTTVGNHLYGCLQWKVLFKHAHKLVIISDDIIIIP